MKKLNKKNIRLTDMYAIAHLGNSLLLLISEDSIGKEGQICIQVDFNNRSYTIYKMDLLMKFNPYDWIDVRNKVTQFYYRDIVHRKINIETIMDMLVDFVEEKRKLKKTEIN